MTSNVQNDCTCIQPSSSTSVQPSPIQPLNTHIPLPSSFAPSEGAEVSHYRRVFKSGQQMETEFVKFLKTIFYQLDEQKVIALMNEILNDPNKTDDEIYSELLARIHETKKRIPILSRLWSLFVLKKGMGKQSGELLKPFQKGQFNDYMEIYDRRYLFPIRKATGMPLNRTTVAVCNEGTVGIGDRLQAGALFSRFPYQAHIPLNDADCNNPLEQPEKTHKAIGDECPDQSIDLIACLGGLHHIPADRVEPFVDTLRNKLRPGGVILLREHNKTDNAGPGQLSADQLHSIASVVHSFVNAADTVPLTVEKKEVREFKAVAEWTELMQNHGFTRISPKELVLTNDPTENAMFAFVRTPTTLDELRQAMDYRKDYKRPHEGTRATWIEWGNVRFAKQYADYVQTHRANSFDYVGHLKQHWQHVFYFIKESLNDPEQSKLSLFFSDSMLMNIFILLGTTLQCSVSAITSLPGRCLAKWRHGDNWRNVTNLTAVERFLADYEKEYADNLDTIPFYAHNYLGKVKELWRVFLTSQESFFTKVLSLPSVLSNSVSFLGMAVVCAPINMFYTQESNREPETVKIIIHDPANELEAVVQEWNTNKDPVKDARSVIEVIETTADGHKLVSLPRYRPFTQIMGYLSKTSTLEIVEVAGQKALSVDLLLSNDETVQPVAGSGLVYAMDYLQDPEQRRYATYMVNVAAMKQFQNAVGVDKIHYIHE